MGVNKDMDKVRPSSSRLLDLCLHKWDVNMYLLCYLQSMELFDQWEI